MIISRKLKLISFLVLAVLCLAVAVDIPRFLNERTSGFLRNSILRAAEVVVPLKDRILNYSAADKLTRLQATGACHFCDLRKANFKEMDLHGFDLRRANLIGVDLSRADLTGANLRGAKLGRANLTRANLTEADLTDTNLNRALLINADFSYATINDEILARAFLCFTKIPDRTVSGCDLSDVNLGVLDLTDANLSGVDLSGADLSGAILTGAYLYDTKLVNADLSEANLVYARLSGADLTGANLRGADLGGVVLKWEDWHLGNNLIQIKERGNYRDIVAFDMWGDTHYLVSKLGILYELKNGESTIVLDLTNTPKFSNTGVSGLMSVASNDNSIYISYTIEGDDVQTEYLVVDEYSKRFNKVRTIIKIGVQSKSGHHAGNLEFDRFGKLYLAVGDGSVNVEMDPENHAQNLKSLRGKILRFDVAKKNPKPEIVAYGLRNPWKFSIDSKNRMFIGDCGHTRMESVYLLDELYTTIPYNLGWAIFEGTERRKRDPLMFQDTLAPIYEYRHYSSVGVCAIGGYYLDDLGVYIFGDAVGHLRLLKEQDDGKWHEIYFQKAQEGNWSFGYDKKTKNLYKSDGSKIFEATISTEQIDLLPNVILCRTAMPNGTLNNSGC